jgi:hypothetical protein
MERARRLLIRAIQFVFQHNIQYYVGFLVGLYGADNVLRTMQAKNLEDARRLVNAYEVEEGGVIYRGAALQEYIKDRLINTFPGWLISLPMYLGYGAVGMRGADIIMILLMIFLDSAPFVINMIEEMTRVPPEQLINPGGTNLIGLNPVGRGKCRKCGLRKGGAKMTDPKDTPAPDWVKDILKKEV